MVFAAVATSSMDALARLGILLLATVLMLLAPPVLARRGLTSTAETISAVGLLLVPLAGYALWAVDRIGNGGASGAVFAGIIFAVTAGVAFGYAGWTGCARPGSPRCWPPSRCCRCWRTTGSPARVAGHWC